MSQERYSRLPPIVRQSRDADGTSHTVVTDDQVVRLMEEGDEMARMLLELRNKMPSDEEIAYLRNSKEADERAAWAWKMIRTHAPWIGGFVGSLGAAAYWLVTHFQFRQP